MNPQQKLLLLAAALPFLTFCSCKTLHVPFRTLPGGEAVRKPEQADASSPEQAVLRTVPASTGNSIQAKHIETQPTSIEAAPVVDPKKIADAARKAGYTPPRLVRPVGYFPGVNAPAMSLPDSAYTGQPMPGHGPPGHGAGCPCCGGSNQPFQFSSDDPTMVPGVADPYGGWMPDAIKKPWPADEYICDGGDHNEDVHVKQNWDVVGLDPEDTIAHFDTVDGRTEVSASNRCCIYAPRFAAVRKVMNPFLYEGHERMAGVEKPTKLNLHQELGLPTTAVQPEQVVADLHIDAGAVFREQTRGIGIDNVTNAYLARGGFLPYENLKLIQRGVYEASEKAVLAERTQAALIWQSNQKVEVLIEGVMAYEGRATARPQMTYTYELEGKPRLRICKIASNCDAQVGDIIEFTLRFDNVGDQRIGNVTVIDHLTPRLEYIADSQSCTLQADFKIQENSDTLVVRWEITDPLEVGQGGLIRFRCKVR